ncbi:MAG TPA: FAD-dependent oxidoreductase [Gaiellaceae bacterium]|nr:FAD-dependent oxidoreductase [Gaiellaceae bacterium]
MAVLERFPELRRPLSPDAALLEADRCLDCAGPFTSPPCTEACPAQVDVPRFIRELAAGATLDAAHTIYRENLLAGTCARVCPVEVLCQGACVLAHEGQKPIEIAALQRFATDAARAAGEPLRQRGPHADARVAVIGAGPAGLACAGELAAHGIEVTVFDEHSEIGGTVRTAIAPYRQVVDPLPAEREALEQLGVRFRLRTRLASRDEIEAFTADADAVFVAVGLGEDRALDCPGADLAGCWPSLEFIAELKHDRDVEVGEYVVVLGGGNTAIDVAREAIRLGARHVTLAYRRTRDEMPAYGFEVDEAAAEGVRFEWLAAPVALEGDGHVERVVFQQMALGEPGGDGRRSIEPVPCSYFRVPADTVVAALGQRPRTEVAEWFEGLTLERGRIVADPRTGRAGPFVYAGGDAVNGGSSVVQAVAEGKRAARAIEEALCAS